jgi:hypothetical protein
MEAYDSLRWDFVITILRNMEFPSNVINRIKECVSATRISIRLVSLEEVQKNQENLWIERPCEPPDSLFCNSNS